MDMETVMNVFLTFLFFFGLFVAGGALLADPRERQDWVMFAGALMASLGEGWFLLMVNDHVGHVRDELIFAVMGFSGLGAMLYAMAFFYDQLYARRVQKLRADLENFNPDARG